MNAQVQDARERVIDLADELWTYVQHGTNGGSWAPAHKASEMHEEAVDALIATIEFEHQKQKHALMDAIDRLERRLEFVYDNYRED